MFDINDLGLMSGNFRIYLGEIKGIFEDKDIVKFINNYWEENLSEVHINSTEGAMKLVEESLIDINGREIVQPESLVVGDKKSELMDNKSKEGVLGVKSIEEVLSILSKEFFIISINSSMLEQSVRGLHQYKAVNCLKEYKSTLEFNGDILKLNGITIDSSIVNLAVRVYDKPSRKNTVVDVYCINSIEDVSTLLTIELDGGAGYISNFIIRTFGEDSTHIIDEFDKKLTNESYVKENKCKPVGSFSGSYILSILNEIPSSMLNEPIETIVEWYVDSKL